MSAALIGRCHPGPPILRSLVSSCVSAGFPSPADDYVDEALDLNEYVGLADPGTYFVRCTGDSMTGAGIFPGDVLVVRRGAEPRSGDIVIAEFDGGFTIKRWVRRGARMWLVPDSDDYQAVEVLPSHEMVVWGVVMHAVRTFRQS